MFRLLNRIAWFVSILMGFVVLFLVFVGFDVLDRGYMFDDDMLFIWVALTFIIGAIIKKLFLSKEYIEERLEFFANAINQDNRMKVGLQDVKGIADDLSEDSQKIENISVISSKSSMIMQGKGESKKDVHNLGLSDDNSIKQSANSETKEFILEKTEQVQEKVNTVFTTIKNFFAENLLIKIGGLFIFLAVLFLLSLIYSYIGSVGKLLLGFVLGFAMLGVGDFLHKKEFKNEGNILLGIGFLINYLVILGGRYLLGGESPFLSEATTFVFLVLNTILAVLTSLYYKSNSLLIFSFIFAYLNPFLIGASSDNPYTLTIYSTIVSGAGLFLSWKFKNKTISTILLIGAFVLGNSLFLLAPFSSSLHWIVKLIGIAVLSIVSFYLAYKQGKNKLSICILALSYLFVILLAIYGVYSFENLFNDLSVFVSILLFSFVFVIGLVFVLAYSAVSFASALIVLPFMLFLAMIFTGKFVFIAPLAVFALIVSLLILLIKNINNLAKYIVSFVVSIFFLAYYGTIFSYYHLDYKSSIALMIIAIVFLLVSYYVSIKNKMEALYAVSSFFVAILLFMSIKTSGDLLIPSVLAIGAYALANIAYPFVNKNIFKQNLVYFIAGYIVGMLFIGYNLYNYGNIYFPGISLGFAFIVLAGLYFAISYFVYLQTKQYLKNEETKLQAQNTILAVISASLAFLGIGISIIFSKHGEFIALSFILQASIAIYFYTKLENKNLYILSVILSGVGLYYLSSSISSLEVEEYTALVPFAVIVISSLAGLYFTKSNELKGYSIVHLITIFLIAVGLGRIFLIHHYGYSIFAVTVFALALLYFYSKNNLKNTISMFSGLLILFLLVHLLRVDDIFDSINFVDNLKTLKILQYISTIALTIVPIILYRKYKNIPIYLLVLLALYFIAITTYYVYDIFENVFVITIYWAILSFALLMYGISKDKIQYRTLGLYLLLLVIGKVILYDVWYSIDNAILRVVALLFVGIMMVAISLAYTKKYGKDLKDEFALENLKKGT